MVLAFSLSAIPVPALAVSSNIVAETKNVDTLTISQIQDLAVIYNDSAKKMRTQMKQLDVNKRMLNNTLRTTQNSINSMGSSSSGGSETIKTTLDALAKQLTDAGKDPSKDAQYQALMLQYQSAAATEASMAASLQSGLESALDGIDQINDTLDDMDNSEEDLNKYMKDLETQMRYLAASLSLSVVQLDKSIELLEDQITLTERAVQVAELQQKLGMNIVTDVETQQASLKEAQKSLEDQKETLSVVKRSINILIGRNAGNPLEVVPMNLPVAIDPAPAYTDSLIKQFTNNNYSLKVLERDKADLQEDGEDKENKLGSDDLELIDYQIEAKNQEIKDKKQTISDDLKALLAKINSDGEAYKVSRQKYVTEKKNFEYAQKKYELGMISEIQLLTAELQLKSAEMTNMQNGYQFYLDWQKYYAAEKGVDMSNF